MNTASGIKTKPCFVAQCPICMVERVFFLLETALGLSGQYLVKGVACEMCAYEAPTTDESEREKLVQASVIWHSKQEGRFTEEFAAHLLDGLDSEVLARVRQEGMTWVCEGCHEKNGMSFLECWNCQRERQLDQTTDQGAEPGATDNPDDAQRLREDH